MEQEKFPVSKSSQIDPRFWHVCTSKNHGMQNLHLETAFLVSLLRLSVVGRCRTLPKSTSSHGMTDLAFSYLFWLKNWPHANASVWQHVRQFGNSSSGNSSGN